MPSQTSQKLTLSVKGVLVQGVHLEEPTCIFDLSFQWSHGSTGQVSLRSKSLKKSTQASEKEFLLSTCAFRMRLDPVLCILLFAVYLPYSCYTKAYLRDFLSPVPLSPHLGHLGYNKQNNGSLPLHPRTCLTWQKKLCRLKL